MQPAWDDGIAGDHKGITIRRTSGAVPTGNVGESLCMGVAPPSDLGLLRPATGGRLGNRRRSLEIDLRSAPHAMVSWSDNRLSLQRTSHNCIVNSRAPADRYCHCAAATGDASDLCPPRRARRWLLVLPTLLTPARGMPEADSADCGGLAPKEVCGVLAVGHQYPRRTRGHARGPVTVFHRT